ncbi:MAG: DUF6115 domain-containing protein [Lachnospiraceae bacterium]
MGALEIVLLVVGGVIFAVSFLIPSGKEADRETRELVKDEVKKMVSGEVNGVKSRIEDITDETVNYAIEKAERSLERISNEKIMAVSEYSDTVLEDINKNHKEVMFLYDMLNDKHQNIKSTVSQVEKTVKEVEKTAKKAVKEAENVKEAEDTKERERTAQVASDFKVLTPKKVAEDVPVKKVIKSVAAETPELDISFMQDGRKNGNNNERILQMHNDGKSNVAIAKELGLGVGEVKLVIDLFEGM